MLPPSRLILALCFLFSFVFSSDLHRRLNVTLSTTSPLLSATTNDIKAAESVLADALVQQGKYNAYRVRHPRRNVYTKDQATKQKIRKRDPDEPEAPHLSDSLKKAAALIAERDAALQVANGTIDKPLLSARSSGSTYWLSLLSGHGLTPFNNNASYPVYRDVTAYGAKGDGVTDDTNAINNAIAAGGNCGQGCLSSSVKGTLIYFPPGTYLISSPINAYYYSQLVGDAINPPTIKTSASFVGLGAIQTDVYIPGASGAEWYIEQSVFFRQVRNFFIDIRATTTDSAAGLHWQVAQATSLTNVTVYASTTNGSTQMGMFTENGSGGFMSNVRLYGGAYGIFGGNQQYTVRGFTIQNQLKACICLIWDWGWTWSGLTLANAPIGISLINPADPNGQVAGSTYIMDSSFDRIGTGVYAEFNKTTLDSSVITLDNLQVSNSVQHMVQYANGATLNIPAGNVDFIVVGSVEDEGSYYGSYTDAVPQRPSTLTTSNSIIRPLYFTKDRPQYQNLPTSSFISVKDHGAKGDGVTDDTSAIQALLNQATTNNVIYFPAGTYIITSTLKIIPSTLITGSVWSQLAAKGSYFANAASPQVMVQVGTNGTTGTVEISDMLFTSVGNLPGLIMVEWNVAAGSTQGSVGMWDTHFRVGGAIGTNLQVAQCPLKGQLTCVAANMMLHVTPLANGYFENVWAWVADHDIDDANNTMVAVAAARGMLIESTGPTWLYGSASEHSMLYQYNFVNTIDTWAGMIQTESPYFQASQYGQSPGPFNSTVGQYNGDPNFLTDTTCNATASICDVSWALMMQGTTNLTVAGAGLYSWFGNYAQDCVDSQNCQQRIAYDDGYNSQLQVWNLITIGAAEMISNPSDYVAVSAKNNTQSLSHPYWSILAGYLDSSSVETYMCADDDTSPGCTEFSTCNLTQSFNSFADLQNAILISDQAGIISGIPSIPDECIDYLALNTLSNTLNISLADYNNVNSGYDKAFKYYQDYMHDIIPQVVNDFMTDSTPNNYTGGAGNQFFNCKFSNSSLTATYKCPVPWDQIPFGTNPYTIEYILTNSSGFYNTLQTQYGINKTWINFQNLDIRGQIGGGCHYKTAGTCLATEHFFVNKPGVISGFTVPNPKDIVTAALPTVKSLQNSLLGAQVNLNVGRYNGSADDINQVYSMPVFLITQAIDSMAAAKDAGQKYEKEEKIKIILEVLGAIFAFLPFLDDLSPELLSLDGVFTALSDAGNVALTIQQIVADPSSAPMAIFEGLAGGIGKSPDNIATLATKRRALTDLDRANVGAGFKAKDDQFQGTVKEKCEL